MNVNTTVLICTAISLVVIYIAYVIGCKKGGDDARDWWSIKIQCHVEQLVTQMEEAAQWKMKYEALQKDIECTVHETHEEVEKPFVDARWLSGELVPSEDQPLYVSKDSKEAEQRFLDSVYGKEPDRREPGVGC